MPGLSSRSIAGIAVAVSLNAAAPAQAVEIRHAQVKPLTFAELIPYAGSEAALRDILTGKVAPPPAAHPFLAQIRTDFQKSTDRSVIFSSAALCLTEPRDDSPCS